MKFDSPTTQLDGWLAEHLFGCRPVWHQSFRNTDLGDWWECYCENGKHANPRSMTGRLPLYSTAGDGMLLVIEEISKRNLSVSIFRHRDNGGYSVTIANHIQSWVNDDMSAPLAVAKAAKAAIEGNKNVSGH